MQALKRAQRSKHLLEPLAMHHPPPQDPIPVKYAILSSGRNICGEIICLCPRHIFEIETRLLFRRAVPPEGKSSSTHRLKEPVDYDEVSLNLSSPIEWVWVWIDGIRRPSVPCATVRTCERLSAWPFDETGARRPPPKVRRRPLRRSRRSRRSQPVRPRQRYHRHCRSRRRRPPA